MARVLNDIAAMAGLMGTQAVLVGMSPEIAIVLMDLGLQLTRVPTARNLEKGLALLAAAREAADVPLADG
jgi:rsbT antagonist protein RsbS